MQFTLYAIRHNPSGGFLPMRWKSSRGYSFDNPTTKEVPRLFKSKRSAERALTAWLMGEWKREWVSDNDWEVNDGYYAGVPDKVESRKREDMEVVPVTLSIPSIGEPAA